jgi:serine/threonine protein kinase
MDRIGRYRITGELGRGAMGVVYRASDPSIGRQVAIKTIRLSEFTNAEERAKQRERLFREARSAGILSHPGIVTIYDMAEEGDLAYIAMEFVNGPTLERIMSEEGPLDRDRIFDILRQTATALDYAHRQGIVHRDIKPANIMINDNGVVKITDFGIAKISASEQLTQAGVIMGTPNYISPEQVQARAVDGRSDQYSLCVIAYEMLTGEKPFVGEHITTLVYQIVVQEPPPAQKLNPSLGRVIESVLRRGLSKEPDKRYLTCSGFVNALDTACRETEGWKSMPRGGSLSMPTLAESFSTQPTLGIPAPPVRRPELEPEPSDSRKFPLIAAALVCVAVVLGWVAFQAIQPQPPPLVAKIASPPAELPVADANKATPMPGATPDGKPERPPAPSTAEPKETEPMKPEETSQAASALEEQAKPQRREPRNIAPAPAEVRINTDPPGARVVLDGDSARACTTPCALKTTAGSHNLSASLKGFKTASREIRPVGGLEDLPLMKLAHAGGTILLQTTPDGASVFVNDQKWPGTTPMQLKLPSGRYNIRIEKGDLRATQELDVREDDFKHLRISLGQ